MSTNNGMGGLTKKNLSYEHLPIYGTMLLQLDEAEKKNGISTIAQLFQEYSPDLSAACLKIFIAMPIILCVCLLKTLQLE